jgi:hypothetical protein
MVCMKRVGNSIAVLFVLILISGFRYHDYHVSVIQMQQNTTTKTLEISMRVFTDDLEMALSKDNSNKRFTISNQDRNDEFLKRYLNRHFEVKDAKKQVKNFKYLGKEQEVDATWIYLEVEGVSDWKGMSLRNDVLMEVFDDQVNMVNFKSESGKKTYLYKKGSSQQNL